MKKFVSKKVPQRSNKKVMSKQNKNTLYAYLLLAAFAIWTICSVLGVIAFFRTQRSAGMNVITAGADEVVPTADSSDIPRPSSRLFDLADSAVWHFPSVSYGKEFTPTYESNGLFSFDKTFKTVFEGEDALTNDAGRNWCGFNFSLQKRVTAADLAFNIFYLVDDSVARSNILGLEVVISNSTVVRFAFQDGGAYGAYSSCYPPLNDLYLFAKNRYITSIRFMFRTTTFFDSSVVRLEHLPSVGSFNSGYNQGYDNGFTDGYEDGVETTQNEIQTLKNGLFGASTSALWIVPELASDNVHPFAPIFDVPGEFNITKTFRALFPNSSTRPGSDTSSIVSFRYDESNKITDLALTFRLESTYLGATGIDTFQNFGKCQVSVGGGVFDCMPVFDEVIDNTVFGHYDFSSIPDLPNSYITGIDIFFLSNSYLNNFTFRIVDFAGYYGVGYNSGYEFGYNAALGTVRNELLSEYRKGYQAGQEVGYNTGYNAGATDAHEFTFDRLLSSVIDTPIKAFTSLFNFEILGVNLANFFFGLLTIMLVLAIIKLIL